MMNYSVPCNRTDKFSELLNKLYEEYPFYQNDNYYYLVGAQQICDKDKNKTLEELKIKNSDTILVNKIEFA